MVSAPFRTILVGGPRQFGRFYFWFSPFSVKGSVPRQSWWQAGGCGIARKIAVDLRS